jgi:uncharacterized protein YigA (DUF484 family)
MSSLELDASQVEREQLVAQWLLSTPGFFERHAELLTQMELANSHSGRAVSLQEKQMHVLRNQNRDLNRRLSDMLRFGSENDKTQSLMVQWLEGLLANKDEEQTRARITEGLNELFEILKNILDFHRVKYENIALNQDFRTGDILHSHANIGKAVTFLGYLPTHNIVEGLILAMPWYLHHKKYLKHHESIK